MSLKSRPVSRPQTCLSIRPSPKRQCIQDSLQPPICQQRLFHASPSHNKQPTVRKRKMLDWLNGAGKAFERPLPGTTNYLSAYDRQGVLIRKNRTPTAKDRSEDGDLLAEESDQDGASSKAAQTAVTRSGLPQETIGELRPYPLNQYFKSESVLSEETREEVYQLCVVQKLDVSSVSAAYGIDMRRVAAVVRLKTIEKQWQAEGKWLAKPYSDAVLSMLPQTPYRNDAGQVVRHESINDLPVHPATRTQVFYPAAESRQFTREDAARVFSSGLLPADKRIPHPEMVELERWRSDGLTKEERMEKLREREIEKRQKEEEQEAKKLAWEQRTQRIVAGRRWDFKFQNISVHEAGPDGRGQNGVGLRYGYPHNDRKRGTVKIPTSVE